MSDSGEEPRGAARRGRGTVAILVGTTAALALAAVWIARAPIAENLIGRELAARNVRMAYDIASIGPRTQRIENVVLGDPRNPDLTAKWVEVDIGLTALSPTVVALRADGVRLRGTYRGGRLSFGEVDRFGSGNAGEGALLPDLWLGLSDARVALATDHGDVAARIAGEGHLRGGFRGQARIAMARASVGGCGAQDVSALLQLAVLSGGRPDVRGPIAARTLGCPASGVALAAPRLDVRAMLDSRLALTDAGGTLSARALRIADIAADRPTARLSIKPTDARYDGTVDFGSGPLGLPGAVARSGGGRISFSIDTQPAISHLEGEARLTDVAPRKGDPAAMLRAAAAGSPLEPLAAKLGQAVRAAGRDNHASARFALDRNVLSVRDGSFSSASGAHVALDPGSRLIFDGGQGAWALTGGGIAMGGGGLPDARLTIAPLLGGGARGVLTLSPYEFGTARLALTPLAFRFGPGGRFGFATRVTLDGPLAEGWVRGLTLPISGGGTAARLVVNTACAPLSWRAIKLSTLQLNSGRVQLCPMGGAMLRTGSGLSGGVRTGALTLAGRLGSSPFALDAAAMTLDLRRRGLAVERVATRIGEGAQPVRFGAGHLDGALANGVVAGRFRDATARIGPVPLDLSEMAGDWRFGQGRLDISGALRVADTEQAARFNPLLSRDVTFSLAGGGVTASGHLRHPTRGGDVARVDIHHDLSTGAGAARIGVKHLVFGPDLQPDDLTSAALGVVANVRGTVDGEGEIRWDRTGVRSTGRFTTRNAELAAAFGPVSGLSTTLVFTDLLGLETAPAQEATIASINPGVEVRDGRVQFQLLRDKRARIEGGAWPFAGGQLLLMPSTLDFDARRARNLIFRVQGLDAGAFINTLELKNISATGTYDGLLPIIFDASGGRIEGGIMVARQIGLPPLIVENARQLTVPCDPARQAGTLSYVGDVSNANMGMFGKLAFDALKNLHYRCLTILLDGALDGEFVTQVAINGVNQGTAESRRSALIRPFLGLPFLFNVKIQAPFRGLVSTYQSFVDPSTLIRNSLGAQYQTVLGAGKGSGGLAVQPGESDKRVTKEGE